MSDKIDWKKPIEEMTVSDALAIVDEVGKEIEEWAKLEKQRQARRQFLYPDYSL